MAEEQKQLERTYLDACLKDGLTVRWPDSGMPIRVYIAPFRWYEKSKQQESYSYNQMIVESFDFWSRISEGKIRFQYVAALNDSQIDVNWRRVDRKSLGHCEYMVNNQSLIYSAEIKIGLSDGILHGAYNDKDEVKHTILHEIGHALGLLGHSDGPWDIMFVPHQFGVVECSPRDVETLKLLYRLPTAFDYMAMGRKFGLKEPFTFHDVIDHIEGRSDKPKPAQKVIDFIPPPPPQKPEVLHSQQDILNQMGKFYLQTSGIQLDPETKRLLIDKKKNQNKPDA